MMELSAISADCGKNLKHRGAAGNAQVGQSAPQEGCFRQRAHEVCEGCGLPFPCALRDSFASLRLSAFHRFRPQRQQRSCGRVGQEQPRHSQTGPVPPTGGVLLARSWDYLGLAIASKTAITSFSYCSKRMTWSAVGRGASEK